MSFFVFLLNFNKKDTPFLKCPIKNRDTRF
nr:MAG TPA: hypothetical protein [Caudoviricetes sp.]